MGMYKWDSTVYVETWDDLGWKRHLKITWSNLFLKLGQLSLLRNLPSQEHTTSVD